MSRLSIKTRRAITDRMTEYAFDAIMAEAKAKAAQCAYEVLATPSRMAVPRMFIKDGWILEADKAVVTFFYGPGEFEYEYHHLELPGKIPMRPTERVSGYSLESMSIVVPFGAGTPLELALKACKQLENQRQAYANDVQALCASCTTTKQLLETMPEIKDFLPDEDEGPRALVNQTLLERLKAGLTAADAAKEGKE